MDKNKIAGDVGKPEKRAMAMRFVLVIGVMSFFADFTYEGARSVYGPFLAGLAASATVVSIVTGFGELVGYGFRLVSGRWADRTGNFWPIAIFGYFVQLLAVPALALANNWPMAAALIVLERFGRATRNPPRDAMLSHAGSEIGFGWAFGIHEALDQFGALFGPLLVAAILAWRGSYQLPRAHSAPLLPEPARSGSQDRRRKVEGFAAHILDLYDGRGAGRGWLRRFSAHRVPFHEDFIRS